MAMGGSHNNKGSRGRSYGLMLLLAFGSALFGVMVLHRLRERRIYTLLVKEKDRQLFSLQHLFQKERQYIIEMKRKAEEMKGKIYSLRTKKMELDRRLMEMQSTIDSLKDEHKAMESALEEKQKEIKMLTDLGKENSQLTPLKESLMQKEAEIEDLKRRLELYPAKVLSVSTEDPSNPPVNLTITLNETEKDKKDRSSSKEESGWLNMSTNSVAGENSTRVLENRNESRAADTNSRELIVEQIQKLESSQDKGFKNASVVGGRGGDGGQARENNDSQEQDGSAMREPKIIANSTEPIVVDGGHVLEQRGENSDVKNENGHITLRKPEHSQDRKQQEGQTISGAGMLEMLDTMPSRLRRHGRLTRTKGKRWRTHAKASDFENNGVVSMSSWRFYRPRGDLRTRRETKASKEGIEEREGRSSGERKAMDSTDVKLPKVATLEDSEYLKNRDVNADPNQQVEQANEKMFKSNDSLHTEIKVNIEKVNVEVTNITSYANKQKLDQVRQPEEEASDTQQKEENEYMQKDDSPEEKEEEVADKNEPGTEAINGYPLKESASNLEEDKEDYKADIDDSEF